MTPSLPPHEFCFEPSSPDPLAQSEDITVAQKERRQLVRREKEALCLGLCHPAHGHEPNDRRHRWPALRGRPMGPLCCGGARQDSSTPSCRRVSLGAPAPARQQPVEWAGLGQVADWSLSHQHLNESSFVVVLSLPASEEHTLLRQRQVIGPGLLHCDQAFQASGDCLLSLGSGTLLDTENNWVLGLVGGFALSSWGWLDIPFCSYNSMTLPYKPSGGFPCPFQKVKCRNHTPHGYHNNMDMMSTEA